MHDTSETYQEQAEEITLLNQRIQELQESEAKYKMLFSNAAEGILVAELQTKQFIHANPILCRMFGWAEEEMLQLGVKDIHPKDSLADVLSEFATLARGEKTCAIDIPCKRKDGSVFYADIRKTSMVLGGVMCNVGYFTDITERKQTEVEHQKLASIVMHSSELVNLADLDGKMIYLNDAGIKMLGISADEVTSLYITQFIPDHLLEKVQKEVLPATMAGGWEGDLEYKNLKSGALTSVHAIIFLIKDSKTGAPLYHANLSLDITDRKQAEDALREREARLQTIFENAEEIIHMIDWDGPFLYISPSWERFTGFPVSETIGKSFANYVHPEDAPACLELVRNVRETGQPHKIMEFRVKHASGKWIWFMNSGVAIKDAQGTPLYFMGVAMDITERKHAEENIRKLNEELEKKVAERTAELKKAIEKLNRVFVGRELRMAELKKRIAELEQTGRGPHN